MDFSQLPKMSKTPTTPNMANESPAEVPTPVAPSPAREQRVVYVQAPYESGFGGVWLSLIAGIIFLAMGATFGRWLGAKLTGKPFPTGWFWEPGTPKAGLERTYFELIGGTAWSDTGLFLMGVALLLDAGILGILSARGRPNKTLVFIAIAITVIAMLINACVVTYLISGGYGLPLPSLIALAVGGFVVFDHMPMLRSPSSDRLPSS
jgi:hypothetical protein